MFRLKAFAAWQNDLVPLATPQYLYRLPRHHLLWHSLQPKNANEELDPELERTRKLGSQIASVKPLQATL